MIKCTKTLRSHTINHHVANNVNNLVKSPLLLPELNRTTRQSMNHSKLHYMGMMNNKCDHCSSLSFKNEQFKCCHNGKVKLEPMSPYPNELRKLLIGNSLQATNFQSNIRQNNSAFTFASMKVTLATPYGHGPHLALKYVGKYSIEVVLCIHPKEVCPCTVKFISLRPMLHTSTE